MEQRKYRIEEGSIFFIIIFSYVLVFCNLSRSAEAYKNYTVGDSLGWYDTLLKPTLNYQKWASTKNFSLGDFLLFNTDNNHSVVQTYNFTTYKLCDYDDATENDTIEWSAVDPSAITTHEVSVAVPLVKQGMNYFFSGNYDGEQCKNGQHFKINVTYGQGLPESLKNPSNDSPGPTSPESGDEESAPDTIVPSNFNNPHDEQAADNEASGSVSLLMALKIKDMCFSMTIIWLVFA